MSVPDTGTSPRFAIVAGEASGDILGAGLIRELKRLYPRATFEGIGGDLMQAEGLTSLYPMERLAVMGIGPILRRLPSLLMMRGALAQRWREQPPTAFIGIDAPEFNLGLEQKLKAANVFTCHYVSPSVWAWRQKRIVRIRKSVDLMLCLLPFEQEIYRQHGIAVEFVGHPLADDIPLQVDKAAARTSLGLDAAADIVGLLPGSRGTEMKYLGAEFVRAAALMAEKRPQLHFVAPLVNADRKREFQALWESANISAPVTFVNKRSREVMAASDVLLMASGTATLEAMLIKRPMVVAYRVSPLSYRIFSKLLTISRFALPNLLADDDLVPEFIQDDCRAELLAEATLAQLDAAAGPGWDAIRERFTDIHRTLRGNADQKAARALGEQLASQS